VDLNYKDCDENYSILIKFFEAIDQQLKEKSINIYVPLCHFGQLSIVNQNLSKVKIYYPDGQYEVKMEELKSILKSDNYLEKLKKLKSIDSEESMNHRLDQYKKENEKVQLVPPNSEPN